MRYLVLFLLLVCCWAPAASGQIFATGGARDSIKQSIEALKLHGKMPMSQFMQLTVVDGLLDLKLIADFPNQIEMLRVEIEGSNAVWAVRKRTLGASPYLTMTRYDFDAPDDAFWSIGLTSRNNYLSIYAQTGDGASGRRVRLTQSGKSLRFSITSAQVGVHQETFSASAESLRQLQAEHPQEVRKYLAPALKLICGIWLFKPGPTDLYRVFTEVPADPQMAKKVEKILAELEADAFQQRESASRELAALGAPAVLVLLRRGDADLGAEARNRVDAFLANHSRLDLEDLPLAKKDPNFLLDSLDDADPAVRNAAKAALEKLARKPVNFDTNLSGPARQQAIDALRRLPEFQKSPATRPTTRPATPTPPTTLQQ